MYFLPGGAVGVAFAKRIVAGQEVRSRLGGAHPAGCSMMGSLARHVSSVLTLDNTPLFLFLILLIFLSNKLEIIVSSIFVFRLLHECN